MIRSVLSNWIGILVTGLIHLILTPILIHALGDFQYGIWILAFSILCYFTLLDLGMQTALLRFVAAADAAKDRQALDQIFINVLAIVGTTSAVVIIVVPLLTWLAPPFFGFSGASATALRWVVFLLGLSLALELLSRMLDNFLRGLYRFDLSNAVKIAAAALRALLLVLAVNQGYGLVMLSCVTLAVALLGLPLYGVLLRHADPNLRVGHVTPSWVGARELMSFGIFSFISTLGNYARFYLDSLVIARVLAVHLVTPFSIAGQMVEYFRTLMIGAMSPLITSFSRLVGERSGPNTLQDFFLRTTRFTSLLSLFLGSVLFLDGRLLIGLWVGDRFLPSYDLLLILTVPYVAMLAQVPSNCLLYALGKHRAMAAWTLAEGLVNLALSVYLAQHYGLAGVALGTAIPMLAIATAVQPPYVLRLLQLPPSAYLRRALARPAFVAAIFLLVSHAARGQASPGGILFLGWTLLWQTGVFGALAFAFGLSPEDRQLAFVRCRQLAASLGLARVTSS